MLQTIHDRTQGWITSIIIGLLIIVFTLWGLHGYLEFSNNKKGSKIIARIAGQSLSQNDFDKAYQRLYQQASGRLEIGGLVNHQKLIEQLKQQVLQQWEETQVLAQTALQANYRISQTLIDSVLLNVPAFQSAGHFSVQNFYAALKAMDYTKSKFLKELKEMLLINQVQQGIIQSAFVLPNEINQTVKLLNQKRDYAYLIIPYTKFLAPSSISASQAFAYYQQHKQDFLQPEQVSIDYIKLSSSKGASERTFVEAKDKLANLAYRYPNSLAVIAKTLGLSINATPYFDRKGGKGGLLENPKIIEAAFSQNVLQGNNSAVITIDPNTALVLRIKQHKPVRVRPYTAAHETIVGILNRQEAIAKAKVFGENLLKKLMNTNSQSTNLANTNLKWQLVKQASRDDKQDGTLLKSVFKLTLPAQSNQSPPFAGFSLSNGDYALVRLIAVHEGNDKRNDIGRKLYSKELAKEFGQLEYRLYSYGELAKVKSLQIHSN